MKELQAKSIIYFKKNSKIQFLIFALENDKICLEIEETMLKFERKQNISCCIKVSWWDFISIFKVPKSVNMYTVMAFFDCLTIGLIYNPNFDLLQEFYIKCNKVIKHDNWKILKNQYYYDYYDPSDIYFNRYNFPNKNLSLNDNLKTYDKNKMKFLSKKCPVYQLIKRHYSYRGNFFNN